MKTAALACLLFFFLLPAFALVPLPSAYGTNELATMRMAADLQTTKQSYFYMRGKLDSMEHEIDRLEIGFLFISVVIGSAGVGVFLLSARDAIRRWRPGTETHPVKPGTESATAHEPHLATSAKLVV